MKNKYFGIYRRDKTRICDCCGKKIEPKTPAVELPMPLGLRQKIICYPCAHGILVDHFMKGD